MAMAEDQAKHRRTIEKWSVGFSGIRELIQAVFNPFVLIVPFLVMAYAISEGYAKEGTFGAGAMLMIIGYLANKLKKQTPNPRRSK